MPDSYILTDQGVVSRIGRGEPEEINQVKKSVLKKVDKQLDEMDFKSVELNETGNMTWFIEVVSADGTHMVTWRESSDATEVRALYQNLVRTL